MKIDILDVMHSRRWGMLACLCVFMISGCSYNKESSNSAVRHVTVEAEHSLAEIKTDAVETETPWVVDPSPERLVLAARYGQIELLRYMLDGGLDVNAKDAYGNTALIAAAANGQSDIVTELLAREARVNVTNLIEQTALMGAATIGDYQILHHLIQHDAKVDLKNNQGETALFYAVQYGHYKAALVLLNAGAIPNIANSVSANKSYSGYTPLMYAATGGLTKRPVDWAEMTQLLLNNGANPDLLDRHNQSALNLAQNNKAQSVINALVDAGAKDNLAFAALSPNDVLLKAARRGSLYQMEQAFDNGANANYVDSNGITPLLAAAYEGRYVALEYLLSAGAEVNFVPSGLRQFALTKSHAPLGLRDLMTAASRGDTALIAAAREGHIEAVGILLDNSAEITLSNRHGETALLNAVTKGNSAMVKRLLSYGANPNGVEQDNRSNRSDIVRQSMGSDSVLIKAVRNGHYEVADLLIKAGAKTNYRGYMGKTALYVAIEEARLNVLNLMIGNQGDPNIASLSGITPLMESAKSGHAKMAWALIAAGANVNSIERPELGFATDSQSGHSMTALMFASRGGHESVVKMLLNAGAETNIHNTNGKSALDEASERGFSNVAQLIKLAGIKD